MTPQNDRSSSLGSMTDSGGGGNRTRVPGEQERLNKANLSYVSGWSTLAELHTRNQLERFCAERDGHECFYCGAAGFGVRYQLDHVTPRAHGGSDSVENLVLACRDCNTEKSSWPGWIWALRDTGLPALIRNKRFATLTSARPALLAPQTHLPARLTRYRGNGFRACSVTGRAGRSGGRPT